MSEQPLPILYNFRRCPYAIRARLSLAVSQTAVELREIVLRDKPASMLALSPKGTVPVLQLTDGRVIDESLDVMRWALQNNDPNRWLRTEFEAATSALIACNDGPFKHWLDRYKYFERHPEHPRSFYREQAETILREWESRLATNDGGLITPQWQWADFALLPFVRQFAHSDDNWWQSSPYPQLRNWLQRFEDSSLFQTIMPKWPIWNQEGPGEIVKWQG